MSSPTRADILARIKSEKMAYTSWQNVLEVSPDPQARQRAREQMDRATKAADDLRARYERMGGDASEVGADKTVEQVAEIMERGGADPDKRGVLYGYGHDRDTAEETGTPDSWYQALTPVGEGESLEDVVRDPQSIEFPALSGGSFAGPVVAVIGVLLLIVLVK